MDASSSGTREGSSCKKRKNPCFVTNLMNQPETDMGPRRHTHRETTPLDELDSIRERIDIAFPGMPPWKKYLCLLARLTLNIVQPSLRDRVKFLLGSSEHGLLAHEGNIYNWNLETESWGVMSTPPQHMYVSVQRAAELLNGLYLMLGEQADAVRTEEYIFAAIKNLPTDAEWWLQTRRLAHHVDIYHEKRTERDWPQLQREMVTKLASDTELMLSNPTGHDVLNHFATWCNTPLQYSNRIHFEDASLVLGTDTAVATETESPRKRPPCYVGIRYKLFPNISAAEWRECEEKLERFMRTCFYNNEGGQALWLASERVASAHVVAKRMILLVGKGGCGKSELARLSSVVWGSHYHGVDNNVLSDAKEFRVASADFLGKMVLNIAEASENDRRPIAEALWKNIITNGHIDVRPNYGKTTICGRFGQAKWTWEMNRLPIIRTDYNAVRRRVAPLHLQASFTTRENDIDEAAGIHMADHLDFLSDPLVAAVYMRKVFVPFCRAFSLDVCRRWLSTDRGLEEMDEIFGSNLAEMRDLVAAALIDPDSPRTAEELLQRGVGGTATDQPPWYSHYDILLKAFAARPSPTYKSRWIRGSATREEYYAIMVDARAILELPKTRCGAHFVPILRMKEPFPETWQPASTTETRREVYNLRALREALSGTSPECASTESPGSTTRGRVARLIGHLQLHGEEQQDGFVAVDTVYTYAEPYRCGRRYARTPSLQTLPKQYRSIALRPLDVHDVDMVSAHYALAWWVMETHFHEAATYLKRIRSYVTQRQAALQETERFYGCSAAQAKNLFKRILYGGSVAAWCADCGIRREGVCEPIEGLESESKLLAYTIAGHRPELLYLARLQEKPSPHYTALSYVLSSVEDYVLGALEKSELATPNGLLFDGLACVSRGVSIDKAALTHMEQHVKRLTDVDISLATKEWPSLPPPIRASAYLRADKNAVAGVHISTIPGSNASKSCLTVAIKNICLFEHARFPTARKLIPRGRIGDIDVCGPGPWTLRDVVCRFSEIGQVAERTAYDVARTTHMAILIENPPRGALLGHAIGVVFSEGVAHLFDVNHPQSWTLPMAVLAGFVADSMESGESPPLELVGLLAGGGTRVTSSVKLGSDESSVEHGDAAGVGSTYCEFTQDLAAETAAYISTLNSELRAAVGKIAWSCDLCPTRAFSEKSQLLQHLRGYHTRKRSFAPGGAKQLAVAKALFDNDRIIASRGGNYLARSAFLMRPLAPMPIVGRSTNVDPLFKLVLRAGGPEYVNASGLKDTYLRRVGNVFYTEDFAVAVFRDAVLSEGRTERIVARACARAHESGSELASLLPTRSDSWEALLEDVFYSSCVVSILDDRLRGLELRGEFESVSEDATYKPCLPLLCQTRHKAALRRKNDQPIAESAALHVVHTLRGRSGAILSLFPSKSESAGDLASMVLATLSQSQRAEVRHWATDDPPHKVAMSLKSMLPRLECMSLDALHLVMMYEGANWAKKSEGSHYLRRIMRKFSACDGVAPEGDYFFGDFEPEQSPREEIAQEQLRDGSMPLATARQAKRALDPNKGFPCRAEFVENLAAVVALHPAEVAKKTHTGKSVKSRLIFAATPSRAEWLFNAMRYRRTLHPSVSALLPCGTTSNEAFHAEVKRWFSGIQQLHQPTLKLKLRILHVAKILAHYSATTRPTSTQMKQTFVLTRVASSTNPWKADGAWRDFCAPLRSGEGWRRATLPLADSRKTLARSRASWRRTKQKMRVIRAMKKRTAFSTIRRTPSQQ